MANGKKMIKKGSIARENRNAGTVSLLSILIRVFVHQFSISAQFMEQNFDLQFLPKKETA